MYTVNKKEMRKLCAWLSIEVAEGATKQELLTLLQDYFASAVAVSTGDGNWELIQTDKPTDEYHIEFSMNGSITVRADSKQTAADFAEDELNRCWNPYLPYSAVDADISDIEIHNIQTVAEADAESEAWQRRLAAMRATKEAGA